MIQQAVQAQQGMSPNRDYDRSEYGRGETADSLPSCPLYRVTALVGVLHREYWVWAPNPPEALRRVAHQRDLEPVAVDEPSTVFTVEAF